MSEKVGSYGCGACHYDVCQCANMISDLRVELKRVTAERDALKADKESWGNEFTAVCAAKGERDRLSEALEVAKTALKGLEWIGNGRGYYCVSDEQAAIAMKSIKAIERICGKE